MLAELKQEFDEGISKLSTERTERMLVDLRQSVAQGMSRLNTEKTENMLIELRENLDKEIGRLNTERTEHMIVELRNALDSGIKQINATTASNNNAGKLNELDSSIQKILAQSAQLVDMIKASNKNDINENINDLRKDTRQSIDALKNYFELKEQAKQKEISKIKHMLTYMLLFSGVSALILLVLLLVALGVITI